MDNGQILISGASIAGPALAYWLRRHNFFPTVVERAPAPREGGQAVDLRGAARTVVERMDLLDDIRRAHVGTRGMSYVDSTNKRLASMSADILGDSGGAIAELEIMRADLVRLLYQATTHDVEYIFNDSIADVSQHDDRVWVEFERGAPRSFDLVVGADGVHSNVRALEFAEESAFVRHLGCYVSSFTTDNDLDLDGWELMYSEPGRTAGIYPTRQSAEARALFFFASPPLHYDRRDIDAQKEIGQGSHRCWEVP